MVEKSQTNDRITLTLRPNRSASWYQSKLFLLVMMIPMFTIAIGWSIVGAWPILPFAGVEFLLLSYITYRVSYLTYQKDFITIDKYKLTIFKGIGKKRTEQAKQVLVRPDTYLYVTKPKKPMDLQILHLADNNTRLEVGHYLNEEDRENLRSALVEAGLVQCSDHWWQDQ